MTPSHFVIFLKGDFLQISSGLEFILGYFCFAEFGVLELSLLFFVLTISAFLNCLEMISPRSVCLNYSRIIEILFSCELARIEFAVLVTFVFRLGLVVAVPVSFFILFLVDPVPFRFLRTLCRFFSCFVWPNPIHWHLKLLVRALVSDVFFS